MLPEYPSDHFGAAATLAPASAGRVTPAPARSQHAKPAAASFFAPRTKKKRRRPRQSSTAARRSGTAGARRRRAAREARRRRAAEFDAARGLRLRRHARRSDWGRPDAWSRLYAHAPRVIRQLAADGHAIVVLSNECLDRYKRLDYLEKKMRDKCSKIQAWAADVNVPRLAASRCRSRTRRAPQSQGDSMWRKALARDRGVIGGFYVGDSAATRAARFAACRSTTGRARMLGLDALEHGRRARSRAVCARRWPSSGRPVRRMPTVFKFLHAAARDAGEAAARTSRRPGSA